MLRRKEMFDADARDYHEYKYTELVGQLDCHSFASRQERVLRLLPDRVDTAVDIGCGSGAYLPLLARRSQFLVAMDFSREMLKQSRASYGEVCDQFVEGDAMRLPLREQCMDLLICIGVLEYLPDPLACLREVHRVLRPGATAVLSVPNSQSLWRLFEQCVGPITRRCRRLVGKGHEGLGMDAARRTLFSVRSIGTLAEQAGLHVRDVEYYNYRLPCLGGLSTTMSLGVTRRLERLRKGRWMRWVSGGLVIQCRRPGTSPEEAPLTRNCIEILACPADKSPLTQSRAGMTCSTCGREYAVDDGLPAMA